MLSQRLTLLPIYLNSDEYMNNYLFELKVKHDGKESFKFVTAKDFEIYPLKPEFQQLINDFDSESDNAEMDEFLSSKKYDNYDLDNPLSMKEKDKIFRPFEYKNKKNYCLITELKTTNTEGVSQEINLYGIPSLSTGKKNARFQSVSCATYSFEIDNELVDSILAERMEVEQITEGNKEYENKFRIAESERYYHRDSDNEPYKYNFSIKSCHFKNETELFIRALEILIDKLNGIKLSLLHLLQDKESSITVVKKNDFVYHYTFNGEGHTIGNLLQSHIERRCIDEESMLQLCGYKVMHPLEESFTLYASINGIHPITKESATKQSQMIIEFIREKVEEIKSEIKILLDVSKKLF